MTIKPVLKTSYKSKDGTYPICIRVIDGKKLTWIKTKYRATKAQWAAGKLIKHPDAGDINIELQAMVNRLTKKKAEGKTFDKYIDLRADQYDAKKSIPYANRMRVLADNLRDCFGGPVHYSDIDYDACSKLDAYLIGLKNGANHRHKKFKTYRQLFAKANTGIPNPFTGYSIKQLQVAKEKLTLAEIEAVEKLDLKGDEDRARDLFLFSYYAKGIRFANCVCLRRSDITGDRVKVIARKDGDHISVKIHPRLKAILDKYKGTGEYIFPFVNKLPEDNYKAYQIIAGVNVMVNRNLKVIAALAGIKKRISFHCARHSFAYHLKKTSGSIHVIKDSLGHANTSTTERYLAALEDDVLDGEMEKLYGG